MHWNDTYSTLEIRLSAIAGLDCIGTHQSRARVAAARRLCVVFAVASGRGMTAQRATTQTGLMASQAVTSVDWWARLAGREASAVYSIALFAKEVRKFGAVLNALTI